MTRQSPHSLVAEMPLVMGDPDDAASETYEHLDRQDHQDRDRNTRSLTHHTRYWRTPNMESWHELRRIPPIYLI
ncbi:MAG: hypothetical protein AAF720_14080 [Pseudomonadota bacterium]